MNNYKSYRNYSSGYNKEIAKIEKSFKYPDKKVCLTFTDGTFTLRNFYTFKKKNDGITFIRQNNTYYKIAELWDGTFDFMEVTLEERQQYNIKDKKDDKNNKDEDLALVEDEEDDEDEEEKKLAWDPNARHHQYDLIKTLVDSDVPVYLHGPAGSGKNYTIKKIADELGLDFYFVNSVQDYFKITGFIDGNGRFHETEFYKAFTQGGLFFLDELDASVPEVLVLLNAAIANRYFSFPTGQVNAHPDFRVIAAGNTVGSGADEMYTGRMVIDMSSVDRFAIVEFDYDKNVEISIAKGNKELVDFVRDLRRFAKENQMRMVFSYRAIEMVTTMEGAKIKLGTILKVAVFKGMDKDSINMFTTWVDNKYTRAMKEIQRG